MESKANEHVQIVQNVLHHINLGTGHQHQREEFRVLSIENELQNQRECLGRDLHDCFGSQLTHLISRLDLLAYSNDINASQILRLSQFAREMNQTLRETIWLLDQDDITMQIFGTRLRELLFKIWEDRENPLLNWKVINYKENIIIAPLVALHLVRITQEATNNALKYANATQINVVLEVNKRELVLTIEDDGSGFKNTNSEGFGLCNMRKRADEMKGAFNLRTSKYGTCIDVRVPLKSGLIN